MTSRDFEAYLRPIIRWWWLIALAAILAAGSAFVFTRLRPPVYIASGTVMIGTAIQERNPDSQQLSLTQGLALTYARIAQRPSLKEATKSALGMDWLPEYAVRVLPDSQLIEISVTDIDPQRAFAVAGELINQLILLSPGGQERQQREVFIQEQLRKLEQGLRDTEDEINRKQDELSTALSARQIRQIEDEISALQAKQATLQSTYVGLLANTEQGSTNTVNVLDPPVLPVEPVNTRWYLLVLMAGALGAALAAAGAYLLEFLDDRILTVDQVQNVTGQMTLGTLPAIENNQQSDSIVMLNNPHSTDAEAFRVLRTNLLFASVDHELHSLLVSSPNPGEGKSFVSANLAVAFAQTGKRVILIDADLRKPTLHRVFGLVNNVGVTSALVSVTPVLSSLLQSTNVPELRVMTSGPLPPNPSELLSSHKMEELLHSLEAECDLVVIDSPPVTVVSDTAVLASRVDGVLVVFAADRVRRDLARNAMAALRQVNARVLGVVLNRTTGNQHGYYYSYQKSYGNQYYSTHYAPEKGKKRVAPTAVVTGDGPPTAIAADPAANANGSDRKARESSKPS
ncbi:MAG: polysaccharide biosynthesis tyrosine autokinase [Caldilinea sp.]|nr:polysaccharide biosynthesis tyrosine autokinase [Caldilinea sp.]MCB0058185.1 polysaccharide biosynthesis tyrosine autokinase [Caldilineaceae bacterium]MCB0038314.1 polysaccharide biosynthesis tyrosine autokinase [Caldilinea sp.]MCB0050356.1 polysaccharide biosynthesis tyrosine autokinase [Caldilinea sp.]MCB0067787.1 polysaccharide biosynthesis tyrosine autokinase [Caldilineaceae bacterium]